jgi:osmotically inducible lipoprotein OsmB
MFIRIERPYQEKTMFGQNLARPAIAAAVIALSLAAATQADARKCRRINKTEGAVVGAVAGGVLGHIIGGRGNRTAGTLIGAGAGGVAGHEIARKKYNKHCR